MPARPPLLVALLALSIALAGCGGDAGDRLADAARERAEELRDRAEAEVRERTERVILRAEQLRERVRERVEEVLADLEQAVPEARPGTPRPTTGGQSEPGSIDAFLTEVITNVDRYWTRTLAASGMPEPRVRYSWVPPGERRLSRCGAVADDRAAFYCPADDTIFVGQVLASDLFEGVARGFPVRRPATAGRSATSASRTSSRTSTRTTSSRSSASSGRTAARWRGPSSSRPTAWPACGRTRCSKPAS